MQLAIGSFAGCDKPATTSSGRSKTLEATPAASARDAAQRTSEAKPAAGPTTTSAMKLQAEPPRMVTNGVGLVSCIAEQGHVRCKGQNNWGQLGIGRSGSSTSKFTRVLGITDAASVAPGVIHVCALHIGGHVSCWGGNSNGQLGRKRVKPTKHGMQPNDESLLQLRPARVSGVAGAVQLVAGDYFTCVRKGDHSAYCWGESNLHKHTGPDYVPSRVHEFPRLKQLYAAASFVCGLAMDNQVYCLGSAWDAQKRFVRIQAPQPAFKVGNPADVRVGVRGVCRVASDAGPATCWGAPTGTAP